MGLRCLISVSTLLASGTAGNLLAPLKLAPNGTYTWLIATVPGGSGEGYRVSGLTPVPLPAALPLAATPSDSWPGSVDAAAPPA